MVRGRHVSGGLILERKDLKEGANVLDDCLPLLGSILNYSDATTKHLHSLLQAEFTYLDKYLFRPEPPPSRTITELAADAYVHPKTIYKHMTRLVDAATEMALTMPIVLALGGAFHDLSTWQICELESPVGREAQGLGIAGGAQKLFGLARTGGDMHVPAILKPPSSESPSDDDLASEIGRMLASVSGISEMVRAFGQAPGSDIRRLQKLGLTRAQLTNFEQGHTLISRELRLRAGAGKWRSAVSIGTPAMIENATRHGFTRLVFENASQDPHPAYAGWHKRQAMELKLLGEYAVRMGLDLHPQLSSITYWQRKDGTALHRRSHRGATGRGVAGDMGFTVSGFDLGQGRDLAEAFGYAEFLATNYTAEDCGERFGSKFRPALVKAPSAQPRALVRALRMIINGAVVSVGRRRQATSLDA